MRNDITMPPSVLSYPTVALSPRIGEDGLPPLRHTRSARRAHARRWPWRH